MQNHHLSAWETRSIDLQYNAAANVVLATLDRTEGPSSVRALYVRGADQERYERIVPEEDDLSFHQVVVAHDAPLAIVNVMRKRHWSHLALLDLASRTTSPLLSRPELLALSGSEEHPMVKCWVSDLLRLSDDGDALTCLVGQPLGRPDGGARMQYTLFELRRSSRAMRCISPLENPFW